jgi:hypothetical protein
VPALRPAGTPGNGLVARKHVCEAGRVLVIPFGCIADLEAIPLEAAEIWVAARTHEGVVWTARDRRILLDKLSGFALRPAGPITAPMRGSPPRSPHIRGHKGRCVILGGEVLPDLIVYEVDRSQELIARPCTQLKEKVSKPTSSRIGWLSKRAWAVAQRCGRLGRTCNFLKGLLIEMQV